MIVVMGKFVILSFLIQESVSKQFKFYIYQYLYCKVCFADLSKQHFLKIGTVCSVL
jgi:hypothetical protein